MGKLTKNCQMVGIASDILPRLRLNGKSVCSYEHDWVVALPPAAGRHDGEVVAGALQQQCVLVPQKVASELHPKVRNHGEGPY